MSWRMFWQIVLLIVIGALILSFTKSGLFRCKYMGKGGYMSGASPEGMHKGMRK